MLILMKVSSMGHVLGELVDSKYIPQILDNKDSPIRVILLDCCTVDFIPTPSQNRVTGEVTLGLATVVRYIGPSVVVTASDFWACAISDNDPLRETYTKTLPKKKPLS